MIVLHLLIEIVLRQAGELWIGLDGFRSVPAMAGHASAGPVQLLAVRLLRGGHVRRGGQEHKCAEPNRRPFRAKCPRLGAASF